MAAILSRKVTNAALPVSLAAMDGCWVFVVAWLVAAHLLNQFGNLAVPSPLLLAGVELAAWWLALRLLASDRLPEWAAQLASGVAGLAVSFLIALIVDPPGSGITVGWLGGAVYPVIVCLGLWFAGSYRASQGVSFNEVYANFRVGLVAIGICALLTAWFAGSRSDEVWGNLGSVALWFFGWALAGLALGNREVTRREAGEAGETGVRTWGMVVSASIALVLVVGSTVSLFGGPDVLSLLRGLVQGILLLVGGLLYLILYGIFWIITVILGPDPFTGWAPPPPKVEDAFSIKGRANWKPQEQVNPLPFEVPVQYQELMTWLAAALVLAVVVWLVSRGLRRTRARREGSADEERGSLGSWELLRRQLRDWLAKALARLRPAKAQEAAIAEADDLAALQGKPEWSGTLTVRQIYARLLRLAADLGCPRGRQQTPIEYLAVLSAAMPDLRYEFSAITGAYLEARYSAVPASGPAVLAANEAWKKAEPELRERVRDEG